MPVECFLIEPTGEVVPTAIVIHGNHRTERRYPAIPERYVERESGYRALDTGIEWDDIDWPTVCSECGKDFDEEAFRSFSPRRLWRRADTGEVFDHPQDAGPGAMWNAHWMPSSARQPDGRYMVAITPDGHEWAIDGHASNCTRPGEDHDCWPRHGEPPKLTVDKTPEPGRTTCSAGAGSIATPGYHGFLRDGRFT